MRIITALGEFILPLNFETTLTRYNVMLTSAGEQTIPFTLPPEPANMKLLGWSNRFDSGYKPIIDLAVTIVDGLSISHGNLGIHTADDEDGISCTLYIGTADFYSQIKDVKLNSLPWPIIKSPTYDAQNLSQRIDYLISILKSEYNTPTSDAIFKIAPLATTQDYTFRFEGVNTTGRFVLNGFDKNNQTLQLLTTDDYLDVFQGEYNQTLVESDTTISLSKGYGMTPFLKIDFILNFIFSNYGYTLDMSELETITTQYPHWCLANNIADAIYTGILKTYQLLPDTTIANFIQKIEFEFAGKFIVIEVQKKVSFKMYRNALTAQPTIDITPYLQSNPKKKESNFIDLVIKNANDKSDTVSESTKNTTDIALEIMEYVNTGQTYKTDLTPSDRYIALTYTSVGEITHLNSSVISYGITKKSETEKSTEKIQLLYIPTEWNELIGSRTDYSFWKLNYRSTFPCFYLEMSEISETTLGIIQWLYEEYKEFLINSNLPITAKANIPFVILEKMNINLPVLIQNQKCLIEKIEYQIGNNPSLNDSQNITLRTLLSYENRV